MKLLTAQEISTLKESPFISRGGVQINLSAVDRAREILGVKLPVKIKIVVGGKSRLGSHRRNPRENFHRITVAKGQSLIEMNKTLWHELQHAKDCEIWYENFKEAKVSYRTVVSESNAILTENTLGISEWLVEKV